MPYDFEGKGLNPADEIVSERQYNKKVFFVGFNQKKYLCHVGHIHYKKNDGSMDDIDPCLAFDDVTRVHKHGKASYECEIPEYADETIKYKNKFEGAKIVVKYKSEASHVLGVYHEDPNLGFYVEYPDAFGEGFTLRIYSHWRTIKKQIILASQPILTQAKDFNFQIVLTSPTDEIRVGNKPMVFDNDTIWDKETDLVFRGDKRIKILNLDGDQVIIDPAIIRDSGQYQDTLKMKLVKTVDGNLKIKQIIDHDTPWADLTYPVFIES